SVAKGQTLTRKRQHRGVSELEQEEAASKYQQIVILGKAQPLCSWRRCGCVVVRPSTRAAKMDIGGTDKSESQKQRKKERSRNEEYRPIGQKITNGSH